MKPTVAAGVVAVAVALSLPASESGCQAPERGCVCAQGMSLPAFVDGFVRGAYDRTYLRDGVFLQATLVRILEVDSLGRTIPDSLRGISDRMAHDFRVARGWRRAGGPIPPDSVRFFIARTSLCPRPRWRAGESYLLFAFRDGDTLRTLVDCQKASPSDSSEAKHAVAALDSLLH